MRTLRMPLSHSRATTSAGVAFAALIAFLAIGCDANSDPAGVPDAVPPSHTEATYSDWSDPAHLGTVVNTQHAEAYPAVSPDGLSLYFTGGNKLGGSGGRDLFVTRRASMHEPWGTPQNLGSRINTSGHDNNARLSRDGHRLYFSSNRAGGFGGFDLYVSRRRDSRDDFGWQAPINLGPAVNSTADEWDATLFEEDRTGTQFLYFTSARAGTTDIYVSTLQDDETFGPGVLVQELSSPANEEQPVISRDGLEMFIASDRAGSLGFHDFWVARRASIDDAWSVPENLGAPINGPTNDRGASLSFDGATLYFSSACITSCRAGTIGTMYDLWMTTRSKLTGP